jgi:hypothetical protein
LFVGLQRITNKFIFKRLIDSTVVYLKKIKLQSYTITALLQINLKKNYFREKLTLDFKSTEDAPMIASKVPGSATHSCFLSSKKLKAVLSIVKVTVFSSPDFSERRF